MRLTEQQKQLALDAAKRHMVEPRLARAGDGWVVIGRGEDDSRYWVGMRVQGVDDQGRVWWCDHVAARQRKQVMAALGGTDG